MNHPFLVLRRCPDDPAAAFDLYDWVRSLTRDGLSPTGTPVRIPDADQEDIAADVLLKLHTKAGLRYEQLVARHPALGAPRLTDAALALGDRLLRRYVRKMIGSLWLDRRRAADRDGERGAEWVRRTGDSTDPTDASEAGDRLTAAADVTRRALDELRASGADFELVSTSFEQQVRLAAGDVEMQHLVDALIASEPDLNPDADWVRARDRLYRRHRLARQYLLAAIDELGARGEVPEDGVVAARAYVEGVLKRRATPGSPSGRPIPPSPGVSPAGDDT